MGTSPPQSTIPFPEPDRIDPTSINCDGLQLEGEPEREPEAPSRQHSLPDPRILNMGSVLDVNLGWLGALQFQDRAPALQGILDQYKESLVSFALAAHYAYIDDVPLALFPELKDSKERRLRFFEVYLPERLRRSRQRISEYRAAGEAIYRFATKIDDVGIDLFQDKIITKLIDLPKAVIHHGDGPEVFQKLAFMSAEAFHDYAQGLAEDGPESSNPLGRYLDAYIQQRSQLSL